MPPTANSFADAWEDFCCKLLNLEERTNQIRRRSPPEQGIDLYYQSKNIAYQCKSVESGKDGEFSVQHAIESMKSAKKAKKDLKWKKYVLCTNVDITGIAEKKLRSEMSDCIVLSKSYWQNLCEKFSPHIKRQFRLLLELPRPKAGLIATGPVHAYYPDRLKAKLGRHPFEILLYSEIGDTIYELTVSNSIKVKDILAVLESFFNLPKSFNRMSAGCKVTLNNRIYIGDNRLNKEHDLKKAGIIPGSLVTLRTNIEVKVDSGSLSREMLNLTVGSLPENRVTPSHVKEVTAGEAASEIEQKIRDLYKKGNQELLQLSQLS